MSKFPFYRQLYQMDCGAACVKMISTYHGQEASIDEIRKFCNVGSDGVSLKGLCVALENLGFNTLAGKLGFDDLCTKAPLPCIIHWDQDHFVVLYKIKSSFHNRVFFIADPARGFIQYKEVEFRENWISTNSNGQDKGTILLAEKGLFFDYKRTPSDSEKTLSVGKFGFLWQYIKRYRSFFFQLLLGTAFCSIIVFLLPFLTQSIVDVGISNKTLSFIYLVLAGQMTLLFGNASVDFLQTRILLHIGARINISLISDFFIKLMKLPMSFFDTRLIGDILQRIEDHKRINQFLTNQLIGLSFSLLTFVAFSIVLFVFNRTIFITFMTFSVVYGIWLLVFLKQRRVLDYKFFDQQAKNQSKTYQLIDSIQETKLHNAENKRRWEWEDIQAEIFDTSLDLLKLQQTQQAGGVFISEARNSVITVLAAASVINGLGSLGMMVAVLFIAGQLSNPIERIMNFIYNWQDVSISLDRIKEIHDEENDDYLKTVTSLDDYDRSIKINEVSFKYPGIRNNYVLKNLSFEIKEGETLAIVGASGSGKTTLLKLLLGYYSPTYGSISIGDIPLSTINQTWWHDKCGVVMQDGYIYSDSIAGNIAVADNHPDVGKLKNAAQIAKIDSFIMRLPFKYNTKIGEDGIGLSKGQKQRVLIARAVYKDPDYLILDEATNSLDSNTERDIVSDLERFYAGKTAIIVAHRLSTVKRANHIIVLDDGEIVEQGTHSDLVSQRGYYYQLIKNQLDLDA